MIHSKLLISAIRTLRNIGSRFTERVWRLGEIGRAHV